jgi:uncharacterized protein YhbP (UPF0306 family)
MNPTELVRQHLAQAKIMQLATSADDQPWVVTVHFYADDELNLYWISTLARRHSQAIEQNSKVATTILVHENTAEEPYVIGITIEGVAELIGETPDETVGQGYVAKLNKDDNFLADIASGTNPHKFYRLKPTKIVLFDNKNSPDNPRQEIVI